MKPSIRTPWVLLPLLVVSMSLQQCSCSEIMGPLLVSEVDEEKLGAEFHAQLLAKGDSMPVFQTNGNASRAALKSYLEQRFAMVHAAIPEPDRTSYHDRFTFTIIDSDVANAFAVPGGYVYIYTGILKEMKSESELMGVLGHELAHVTRHHYRDALAQQVGLSVLIDAVTGGGGALTQFVGQFFGSMMSLSVSRENEYEADATGTIYLSRSGRHPTGIADFFSRMKDAGLAWLSTHPASSDRVDKVQAQVQGDATMRDQAANSTLKFVSDYEKAVCGATSSRGIDYCPN
jgi:predicted Zn-dependent protease